MSLLADLLSKNKAGPSRDGKDIPAQLNVPPTLSKAHGNPAQVRRLNIRYVIISAVSVVLIALGALLAIRSWLPESSAKKKPVLPPRTVQQPAQNGSASVGAASPQAGTVQPVAQANAARITLEEPPSTGPQKKESRPARAAIPRQPSQHSGSRSEESAKPATAVSAQKAERTQQQHSQPVQKAASPPKIDTAARDSLLYAARSAEQALDWKTALANYRRAQAMDPGNYKIMSNVAAALNNLGMFDDGVEEAERALKKKPDYVPALINAAIGYSSKGNIQKALRYFTYASAIEPGNRNLVINLGILHERSGNLDAAQATYRQLANAGDPLALQGMGRVYERKGNRVEAVRVYKQIIALPNAGLALKKEVKEKLSRLEE